MPKDILTQGSMIHDQWSGVRSLHVRFF